MMDILVGSILFVVTFVALFLHGFFHFSFCSIHSAGGWRARAKRVFMVLPITPTMHTLTYDIHIVLPVRYDTMIP